MGINVLSLFDGMSCGRIALERAGIKVNNYFASEVDKHAIFVSKNNWNDIIHIGDVRKIKYSNGILYTENGNFTTKIDLLIGGSPCQDFSIARAMGVSGEKPKGLGGDKSSLFYEYLRIKNEINPKNWLLENVRMSKLNKDSLDNYLQKLGVEINSNLVSFQNRSRIYWSSGETPDIRDRHISFQEYKCSGNLDSYKLNPTSSRLKMWNNGNGRGSPTTGCKNVTYSDKVACLTTKQDRCPNAGLVEYKDFCRYLTQKEIELAQTVPVGYTSCLSYNQASKVLGNGWTVDIIVEFLTKMDFS